jgi:hypothetical protein
MLDEHVALTCPTGLLDISQVQFGVMSSEISNHFYCTEKAIWADPANNKTQPFTHCTDLIDN